MSAITESYKPAIVLREQNSSNKLSIMIGEQYLKDVKYLEKNTFDPVLWMTLNETGPAAYHWLTKDELKPGWLWAQEDAFKGITVLWATESGWIQRAYLAQEESTVVVEFYMAHIINIKATKEEISTGEFRNLIGSYLSETSAKKELARKENGLTSFQKQLELMTIVCKITRAACEKMAALRKEYSGSVLDMSIVLGVDESSSEPFNPMNRKGVKLVEISNYFVNGRLPFLHQKEGKPNETSEPIAPVIRSWEALDQVGQLRKMTFGDEKDKDEIFHLDPERKVSNLSSLDAVTYENLKTKSLKDLHAWFVLIPGGIRVESYEFKRLGSQQSDQIEKLELSIDFNETWKLQSKFYPKI